jgi:hypothetical protein
MRRILLLSAAIFAVTAGPAAASSTVRLEIVHYFRGCHVWSRTAVLGPSVQVNVKRGARLTIRVSCPMDFDLSQTAGPALSLGSGRIYAGTTTTILFKRSGLYKLLARNVKSSEEAGLQTLGDDNLLKLTVRVR